MGSSPALLSVKALVDRVCLVAIVGVVSSINAQDLGNSRYPLRQQRPNGDPRNQFVTQDAVNRPPANQPPQNNRGQTPVDASRHRGVPVVDVRIAGNRSLPSQRFFQHIKTRPGRGFDPEGVQQDVLRLYRENLVSGVRTLTQEVPQGLIVTFEVVERPTIQYVKFIGNRYYSDKGLLKQAKIKPGEALNPYAVTDARRRLEEFYHKKGRIKTSVSVFEGDKQGDRGAVFYITEGRKEQFNKIRFIGNTPSIVSTGRLKTKIKSKPGFMWYIGGHVNRQAIDEDVDRLTAYYRSLGFFKARVGRELSYSGDGRWLTLTFVIDEGPRYRIRNVTVEGNSQFAKNDLLGQLKLKANEFFDLSKMESDRATLADLYGSNGFVYAKITPDPRFLEEPGVLDVTYQVEEGQQFYVGKININIVGESPHTKKKVILDRLSFRSGDLADIGKIRSSERRIIRSQLFEHQPGQGITPRITFQSPELREAELARRSGERNRRYPGVKPGGVRR